MLVFTYMMVPIVIACALLYMYAAHQYRAMHPLVALILALVYGSFLFPVGIVIGLMHIIYVARTASQKS